jgi:hypothetical protein
VGRLSYVLAIALTPLSSTTAILQATPIIMEGDVRKLGMVKDGLIARQFMLGMMQTNGCKHRTATLLSAKVSVDIADWICFSIPNSSQLHLQISSDPMRNIRLFQDVNFFRLKL